MREYEIEIDDIKSGLRQWKSNARNAKGKTQLHCLMPQSGALVEMDLIAGINETTASYVIDEGGDYVVDEGGDKVII